MNAPDRLANLRVNPDWAKLPLFDRAKWQRVRFGDVVENLNETCDPAEAGIDRYIGLEHLEAGSLRIRTWGNVADGTTFTRRARPGQVLFGKRRAYQRKVAAASFDAVVSGDIYVLAPKGNRLFADLLPFLCMSDRFFNHAVDTSAGSLSPRTNWSSLARFEFDLPPLEQQQRISLTLASVDEKWTRDLETLSASKNLRSSILDDLFPQGGGFDKRISEIRTLQELCAEQITYGIVQAGPNILDGVPYIRVSDMTKGPLRVDGMLRTAPEIAAKFRRSTVRSGELVCALRGKAGLLAFVPPELDGANLTQGTARIALKDQTLGMFVTRAFESPFIKQQLKSSAKGSTFVELTLASLRAIRVPLLHEQSFRHFSKTLDSLDEADTTLTQGGQSASHLRNQLLRLISQ